MSLPECPSDMPGLWLVSVSEDTKVSPKGAGWAELRPETLDGERALGPPRPARPRAKLVMVVLSVPWRGPLGQSQGVVTYARVSAPP